MSQSTPPRSRGTILCIDDDKLTLGLNKTLLEAAGYRVLGALTPAGAMALFVANEIDLVLSEQLLSTSSGAELSIFMKEIRPSVAIVLLSVSGRVPARISRHVDAVVEKGGSAENLLDCVHTVLVAAQTKHSEHN